MFVEVALGGQFNFVVSVADTDTVSTAQQLMVSRILADPATWGLLLLGE